MQCEDLRSRDHTLGLNAQLHFLGPHVLVHIARVRILGQIGVANVLAVLVLHKRVRSRVLFILNFAIPNLLPRR